MDNMSVKIPTLSREQLYNEISRHLSSAYATKKGMEVNIHSWEEKHTVRNSVVETNIYVTFTDADGVQGTDVIPGTLWEVLK